jgi:hypothetical protein
MEYISGEQEQLRDMPHPGFKHSPETRARLSAAHVGKRHSPETRQKISAANIGKHPTKGPPEHCAAVSAANRGREFSLTHRERISPRSSLTMSASRRPHRQRSVTARRGGMAALCIRAPTRQKEKT